MKNTTDRALWSFGRSTSGWVGVWVSWAWWALGCVWVTCVAAPAGLNGGREAGHSSQRQVAQCKQLILAVGLRSCCNYCSS